MALAIRAPPGGRSRDAEKAPCSAGEQQTNCTQREWCPVLSLPPVVATAPQASRNTYQTDVHHGSKKETLYDNFSGSL